jgi:NTP pyrophosphatase (non-canonical NTP hydrolase)
MNFKEYQEIAHSTAVYNDDDAVVYTILGLANEAGEVAGKLKKYIRGDELPPGPSWQDVIGDELGDVLWYLAETCTAWGIDLDRIATNNAQKLADRAERGVLKGSGDKR